MECKEIKTLALIITGAFALMVELGQVKFPKRVDNIKFARGEGWSAGSLRGIPHPIISLDNLMDTNSFQTSDQINPCVDQKPGEENVSV